MKPLSLFVIARIVIAFGLMVASVSIPVPKSSVTSAQYITSLGVALGEIPYGGKRIFTIECLCVPTTKLIIVQDTVQKRPLFLLYVEGVSRLYSFFNTYGAYLLGSYKVSEVVCVVYVPPKKCVTIPAEGTLGAMPGTGTSL